MCQNPFGDSDDKGIAGLQLNQALMVDPETERRQKTLWNQAQTYAGTDPFQTQYGPPGAFPGLSAMSQKGQQYLTGSILGEGAYGGGWVDPNAALKIDPTTGTEVENLQNLGFSTYQIPPETEGLPPWGYTPKLEIPRSAVAKDSVVTQEPSAVSKSLDENYLQGNFLASSSGRDKYRLALEEAYPGTGINSADFNMNTAEGLAAYRTALEGLQSTTGGTTTVDASTINPATGLPYESVAQGRIGVPLISTTGTPPLSDLASVSDGEGYGWRMPRGVAGGVGGEVSKVPSGLLGTRGEEEAARAGARPYSPTVGVRGMEEGGDVTRRMLREVAPTTPGYDQFLPAQTDPITGAVTTPAGWQQGTQAGVGATPGFTRDATGNLVPIKDFGFAGAELGGPDIDPETGEPIPGTGYRPGYDAIRGQVTGVGEDAVRATPFGVDDPTGFTFGALGPEGDPLLGPEGLPAGDLRAVRRAEIAAQTGYGEQAIGSRAVLDAEGNPVMDDQGEPVMESALPMTETERELSQIGQAARPGQVYDPLTDTYTTAAVAERIDDPTIGALGQFKGPDDLLSDVMTPEAITDPTLTGFIDPVTKKPRSVEYDVIGGPVKDPITGKSKSFLEIAGPTQRKITSVTGQQAQGVTDVTPGTIVGPGQLTIDPVTGQPTEAVGGITPGAIAGPGGVTVDPITGQVTEAVGGVAPGEFGGASFLGGPAIQDYLNQAGVEASVAQARQDYEVALNREKARQAQVGAFGSRGTVEEAGLIEAQERNIAQIRGAGFERAAQLMEADTARRQQAGMQGQQLGVQTGLAGQALEARRREVDAARAQQAALAGQQLGTQAAMQTQQLAQAGGIRGAELGLQAGMQTQQLEAQRREADAARAQQAALAGQQLGVQAGMQTQQLTQAARQRQAELGVQTGLAGQSLEAQRLAANAARTQQAALAGQQWGAQAGMQTEELQQQAAIQTAQNKLIAAQSNQQSAIQTGTDAQRLEAQRQVDQARMGLAARQQTQQLGFQGGMQAQQLTQQVSIREAELGMEAARANQATALASGSQTQQIQASRQMRQAELNLQRQQQTQQLGLQAGMQQAGFGQQTAIRQAELDLQREQATQGLGAEAFMQQQQLGQQATMATASNALEAARADQQAALASGNQAAALEAARRAQGAQAQIDIASQTQRLGAGAAGQQAQLEAVRRQRLSEMGLQAQGVGLDAEAQFRQQQLGAAQQLADIGGMRQGATFGAATQLQQMGAQQEQARRAQMAFDYEQWLRGQEGGAESLALVQSMMPGAQQWQYGRKPSLMGQVAGGLLGATGLGLDAYRTVRGY